MKKVTISVNVENVVEKLLTADGGIALMSIYCPEDKRLPVLGHADNKLLGSMVWLEVPGVIGELGSWIAGFKKEGESSAYGSLHITFQVTSKAATKLEVTGSQALEDILFLRTMESLMRECRNNLSLEFCKKGHDCMDSLKKTLSRIPPARYRLRPYWY